MIRMDALPLGLETEDAERMDATMLRRHGELTRLDPAARADDIRTLLAVCSYPDAADRKSTRLNSSHIQKSRMPSSA